VKQSLSAALNAFMLLFGLALLASLTRTAFTSESVAFRLLSSALALGLAIMLAKVVSGWWRDLRSRPRAE